jgi:hypothetical protein
MSRVGFRLVASALSVGLCMGACTVAPSPVPTQSTVRSSSPSHSTPSPTPTVGASDPERDPERTGPILTLTVSGVFEKSTLWRIVHFRGKFMAYGCHQPRANAACGVVRWVSRDGTHWSRPRPIQPNVRGLIVRSPNRLVLIDQTGITESDIWTSADGWHFKPTHSEALFSADADGASAEARNGTRITSGTWGPSGFVLVGSVTCSDQCTPRPARGAVWKSNDGTQWQRVPYQRTFHRAGISIVLASRDRYVAIGRRTWTSRDGLTWRTIPQPFGGPNGWIGVHGRQFVAGTLGTNGMSDGYLVRASSDGSRWSRLARFEDVWDMTAIVGGQQTYAVVGNADDQKKIGSAGWRILPTAIGFAVQPSSDVAGITFRPSLDSSGATDAIQVDDRIVVVGWQIAEMDPENCQGTMFGCSTEDTDGAVWVGRVGS